MATTLIDCDICGKKYTEAYSLHPCNAIVQDKQRIPLSQILGTTENPQRKLEREFWEFEFKGFNEEHDIERSAELADTALSEWKKRFGEPNANAQKE